MITGIHIVIGVIAIIVALFGLRDIRKANSNLSIEECKPDYRYEPYPDEGWEQFMARMGLREDEEDRIANEEYRRRNPKKAAMLDSLRDGSHWRHRPPKKYSGRVVIVDQDTGSWCGMEGVITDSIWSPGGGAGYTYLITLDNGEGVSAVHNQI